MKRIWLISFLLWTLSGMAAEADIATAISDTMSLNEETVTAIKQSSDLRTQATALTVIGRQEAERNQVLSVKTAADLVPNLFIPDYGSRMTSKVYVRGIGTRIDQPAVGLTIDNVPVMTKENYDFDLTDITRFEMLRGPQSTLYGRNTLGGLMGQPRHMARGSKSLPTAQRQPGILIVGTVQQHQGRVHQSLQQPPLRLGTTVQRPLQTRVAQP